MEKTDIFKKYENFKSFHAEKRPAPRPDLVGKREVGSRVLKIFRCENCEFWRPTRRSRTRWVWGWCEKRRTESQYLLSGCQYFEIRAGSVHPMMFLGKKK